MDSSVDLANPKPEEIEEDSDLTNDPAKKDEHVKSVVEKKPKALTGNTFYSAIHGLYCASCGKDTNDCKCAKTSAEAEAKQEEMKKQEAIESINKWAKELKVEEYMQMPAEKLSKGNQQKIQFMTAIIHNPELVVLDEPFSGLDPVNTEILKNIIINIGLIQEV